MFESFYGMSRTPFSRDIPTEELYPSVMLEEMLGRLEYAAERQLFAVITGDCGTGKTTTIRRFTATLKRGKIQGSVLVGFQAYAPPLLQRNVGATRVRIEILSRRRQATTAPGD